MDIKKALETVAKLYQEKDEYHKKKIKAKKQCIVCLIIGLAFLIPFIVTMIYSLNNIEFTVGMVLFIIFAIFAFIFLEAAIVFFVLYKSVYAYQEESRKKILEYIEKEVNQKNIYKTEGSPKVDK